jgi:hypothetical protein
MPAAVVGDVGLGAPLLHASGRATRVATQVARQIFRYIDNLSSIRKYGSARQGDPYKRRDIVSQAGRLANPGAACTRELALESW